LGKKFDDVTKKELYELIKELYEQLFLLDKINLSHNQLQVGKNILVQEKIINGERKFFPTIIDFEKATLKKNNKTKNIGQIESFLFYNPHGIVAKKIREKLNLKL
jgi:predicted Ser/Thr protein kinase